MQGYWELRIFSLNFHFCTLIEKICTNLRKINLNLDYINFRMIVSAPVPFGLWTFITKKSHNVQNFAVQVLEAWTLSKVLQFFLVSLIGAWKNICCDKSHSLSRDDAKIANWYLSQNPFAVNITMRIRIRAFHPTFL